MKKDEDKSGDDYFTMAISSPRKRCPKCGHMTGGTRYVRVKRKPNRVKAKICSSVKKEEVLVESA